MWSHTIQFELTQHDHQSNGTYRRSSYKVNSYLMLDNFIESNLVRLLKLCSCSAIFLMQNWQKYAYIISKLCQTFLPQATHAPLCPCLSPFTINFSPFCFHIHLLPFEPCASQNPCLQNPFRPILDAEELSLEGSFMPYFPAHQCEDICPPLTALIPTS